MKLAYLYITLSLVESSISRSYSSFTLGNGPLFETKISHGSHHGIAYHQPKHDLKSIPFPSKNNEADVMEDDSDFLPTSTYENKPTPSTLLYLRPTYKPNPEPFIPSPKLYDLDFGNINKVPVASQTLTSGPKVT